MNGKMLTCFFIFLALNLTAQNFTSKGATEEKTPGFTERIIKKLFPKSGKKQSFVFSETSRADIFKQYKYTDKISGKTMSKIVNSYLYRKDNVEAEYWYSRLITEKSKAEDILSFAEVLQKNCKCADAARWYQVYKKKERVPYDDFQAFLSNCPLKEKLTVANNIQVENLKGINTRYLDFLFF